MGLKELILLLWLWLQIPHTMGSFFVTMWLWGVSCLEKSVSDTFLEEQVATDHETFWVPVFQKNTHLLKYSQIAILAWKQCILMWYCMSVTDVLVSETWHWTGWCHCLPEFSCETTLYLLKRAVFSFLIWYVSCSGWLCHLAVPGLSQVYCRDKAVLSFVHVIFCHLPLILPFIICILDKD